jgi:TolB-like protein
LSFPRRAAWLAAWVALSLGCGYRLAGTGGTLLPKNIKHIAVLPFANRTTRPEIEQRVTEAVARLLSRRGGYKVVTEREGAEATLEGAVTSYRTHPVQFGAGAKATRFEAVVTLQGTLRDLTTDHVLWSQDGLVFREQFDVQEALAFQDQESAALDDIAKGAADVLVISILEGF